MPLSGQIYRSRITPLRRYGGAALALAGAAMFVVSAMGDLEHERTMAGLICGPILLMIGLVAGSIGFYVRLTGGVVERGIWMAFFRVVEGRAPLSGYSQVEVSHYRDTRFGSRADHHLDDAYDLYLRHRDGRSEFDLVRVLGRERALAAAEEIARALTLPLVSKLGAEDAAIEAQIPDSEAERRLKVRMFIGGVLAVVGGAAVALAAFAVGPSALPPMAAAGALLVVGIQIYAGARRRLIAGRPELRRRDGRRWLLALFFVMSLILATGGFLLAIGAD